MKPFLKWLFTVVLLFGMASWALAGPEEELAQARQQRLQAFNAGNLEAYIATWADNAAYTPPSAPFRVEGKEAIRAYFAGLLETFPTHPFVGRQSITRFYHGTTAVVDQYYTITLVDRTGKGTTRHGRQSQTWVKLGDRWLVVDQHNSLLPASP